MCAHPASHTPYEKRDMLHTEMFSVKLRHLKLGENQNDLPQFIIYPALDTKVQTVDGESGCNPGAHGAECITAFS